MSDTSPIDVMICVNNPDNGNYCGRLAGVNIRDFLDLEPVVLPEPHCTLKRDSFSVHRCRVPVLSHQTWVGNWCWDSIRVSRDDAAKLVSAMLSEIWTDQTGGAHHVWCIECAHGDAAIELMNWLSDEQTITTDDVLRAMNVEIPDKREVLRP